MSGRLKVKGNVLQVQKLAAILTQEQAKL